MMGEILVNYKAEEPLHRGLYRLFHDGLYFAVLIHELDFFHVLQI